jgi:hypothetical protein
VLHIKEYEALCSSSTSTLSRLKSSLPYHHDINVLVRRSQLAMLRLFAKHPVRKVVHVTAPLKALAREKIKDWVTQLEPLGKIVVELTDDYTLTSEHSTEPTSSSRSL